MKAAPPKKHTSTAVTTAHTHTHTNLWYESSQAANESSWDAGLQLDHVCALVPVWGAGRGRAVGTRVEDKASYNVIVS